MRKRQVPAITVGVMGLVAAVFMAVSAFFAYRSHSLSHTAANLRSGTSGGAGVPMDALRRLCIAIGIAMISFVFLSRHDAPAQ